VEAREMLEIKEAETLSWSRRNFAGAELSDIRRVDRVIKIAEAMARMPGESIPRLFDREYDIRATYRLFKLAESTPDNLQAGHRENVLLELEKPGVYLLLEDTTELSWLEQQPKKGLGPTGSSKSAAIGFHLHSVLAVKWSSQDEQVGAQSRPPVEVIGLADQQYNVRKPRPEGEAKDSSYQRKKRQRESEKWQHSSQRIGPAPRDEKAVWIKICDREADDYHHLLVCQQLGYRFIIRATRNRCLTTVGSDEKLGHLFTTVAQEKACGQFAIQLRSRLAQSARTAQLSISISKVCLRPPHEPGRAKLDPINCNVVRVWEENPPSGIEPIEWLLLTDLPVNNFEQALEIALQYSTRWLIEEFHKALKTGLKAEDLQLHSADELFPAIAIMSVVALRLLDLRERVRINPSAPASQAGLDELELEILSLKLERKLHTVADVALAIGRLGGHMNRKADGLPGLITLWRGMLKLSAFLEGARLARKLTKFD
jgi:hypothetical protein